MKRIIFILFFLFFTNQAQSNEKLINSLKEGGKLVFIRHALAPGEEIQKILKYLIARHKEI